MTKSLKVLFGTTLITTMALPLVLISCSNNVPQEVAKISIDREKLEGNFAKGVGSEIFTPESIDSFIIKFNEAPQNYFLSATPIVGITPFINANINAFNEYDLDATTKKMFFKAEASPNSTLPSFGTIKFTFDLKSSFKSEVVIVDSPTETQEPSNSEVFSMSFRTLLPITPSDKESRDLEIKWIRNFLDKDFFGWSTPQARKSIISKNPTEASKLIQNRIDFEGILKSKIPFPTALSGWDYAVIATPSTIKDTSLTITFTLSNPLFATAELTEAETISSFEIEGLVKP